MHNILAVDGFTPKNMIFPVSATMLKNMTKYDESLEAFSKPLLELAETEMDAEGRLTVLNDTSQFLPLHGSHRPGRGSVFIHSSYNKHRSCGGVVLFSRITTPQKQESKRSSTCPTDGLIFFIKFCHQNNGKLSAPKTGIAFQRAFRR